MRMHELGFLNYFLCARFVEGAAWEGPPSRDGACPAQESARAFSPADLRGLYFSWY